MKSNNSVVRRVFVGREVGIVFGILLAGTILVPGSFLPAYLAVLLASGLRNIYISGLGSGPAFYAVAFAFLYIQAVGITSVYLTIRSIYRSLGTSPPGKSRV